MTNFIILIVVCLVVLFLAIAVLTAIVNKWPIMGFVFGAIIGIVIGLWFHWIAGIFVGLISWGWLAQKAESLTKECSKCGSHDTRLIKSDSADGKSFELWECNKCGQQTIYYEQ